MNKYRTNSTIRTYSQLGKPYIEGIEKLAPEERSEFIDQFPKGSKILDIGCAGGRDAAVFAKARFVVTGIDPVAVFIREAKKRVPEGLFIKTDIQHLPFQPKSFNGIECSRIIRKQNLSDTYKRQASL